MANKRNDHSYTKKRDALKRQCKANNKPCALCGKPIDYTLPYTHAMSFTADHIEAIANGGKMLGPLQPAHRSCNSRKGANQAVKEVREPKPSRDW